MRYRFLALLLLVFPLTLPAQTAEGTGRTVSLFNFDWKFHYGEAKDAQLTDYNDSGWRKLDLPHDFQIEQPWLKSGNSQRGFKELGTGWYRKSFKADPAWKGRKVSLDFEGVMTWGEVWLNGNKVAEMDFGYLGYEADISKYLNYESDNIVAVYASTKGNSRWYTGGGLFRDVNLVVRDTVSIARHGVFITTPRIGEGSADVAVQVELEGITGKQIDIEIKARVFSPEGKQVAESVTAAPKGIKLKTVEVP